MTPCGCLRPSVWRIADMPVAGSGRLDQDIESGLACNLTERTFGHGRAADIAEANEENCWTGRGCHRLSIAWRPTAASRQKKFGRLKHPFLDNSQLKWQR
jgi:hypothetical protein